MTAFATLLERLAFTPQRLGKERLLADAFTRMPDPERGLMLAALTGDLKLRQVTPSLLRGLTEMRADAQLFSYSYDFVGDLAETIALIWPEGTRTDPPLSEVVHELATAPKTRLPALITARLDSLGPSERYAYLKLATGALRVGVSARLARTAFAAWANLPLPQVEEIWHALQPPYLDLFAWASGSPRPEAAARAPFRPVMLSTPTDLDQLSALDPADFAAEWKWDGIRIQAVSDGGTRRLYSRTGEDISTAFPDVVDLMAFDGTLDGELLVRRDDEIASFADLQQRLNRKTVTPAMLRSHPAGLRLYDVLIWNGQDLRDEPYDARRAVLAQAVATLNPRIDLSPDLPFATWDDLAALRLNPPAAVIEGVMIKRRDSPYLAGRMKGPWFKWKRDPHLIDAVLMYAQRGHGKRSGYYSDFTFGVWNGDDLVPVGKAYFGFTDAELKDLDRFVRTNTIERFGVVRSVARTKVVEVAFEGLNRSSRHKSGVAMRFPRINRIRDDKPAVEADHLSTLQAMLTN
ncbi:cisplatin damage response ATP-dependent DNA ligase [Tabrizicola sp.]|uniref:cisplatin damage response ATP-dependent DNA ligase n=1 Tax=Tabrizicola sp. TaxID=2005166 RepID=UPI001A4C75BF|nr:cisplatin damage response ATP-dependent DNA ligase [Tabrizicola sp.]MBL9063841.1 cisplatin damage response ATP-dependent DNA ligase [Tabrizicola sp.]